MDKKNKEFISLDVGSGGYEMNKFISEFTKDFFKDNWKNTNNDSSTYKLPNEDYLFFSTDSFIVSPIEFPNKNIGHIAISGIINDLVVMGANPIGLSCSIIVEEGFDKEIFNKIIKSISDISNEYKIPISTGDTKVVEKGKLDKIIINMSGVGISKKVLNYDLEIGDKIILTGGIAEHAVALLSKRFNFKTNIESDSKPLICEFEEIKDLIKLAKDPTRGGIAMSLNEISEIKKCEIDIFEKDIPIKNEVKNACNLLGLDVYTLACEGRAIIVCSKENAEVVLEKLKKFNSNASIIGEVKNINCQNKVILKTEFGSRILEMPRGQIVPRIC